jgi:hypothetical protein
VEASVRVEVQMASVSSADALSLVPALLEEKSTEEAFARLQRMLARDEAALLGWPVVSVRNGSESECGMVPGKTRRRAICG